MQKALELLRAAGGYVVRHPDEATRALKNALELRFGVPLDALRWLATQVRGKRAPRDITLDEAPGGLRVGATVRAMGTTLRAAATLAVERVVLSGSELRVELRVRDVDLSVPGDDGTSPVAAFLKSGALDLSKPGNLVGLLPTRPALLADAKDDLIALDFLRLPALADDARLHAALGALTSLVTVTAIETRDAHLDVALRLCPEGVPAALAAALAAFAAVARPAATPATATA